MYLFSPLSKTPELTGPSQDSLDYSELLARLEEAVTDSELRSVLRPGLADCQRTVECLHQPGQLDTRTQVARAVHFLKCVQATKTEACVKKNIKRKLLEKLK